MRKDLTRSARYLALQLGLQELSSLPRRVALADACQPNLLEQVQDIRPSKNKIQPHARPAAAKIGHLDEWCWNSRSQLRVRFSASFRPRLMPAASPQHLLQSNAPIGSMRTRLEHWLTAKGVSIKAGQIRCAE